MLDNDSGYVAINASTGAVTTASASIPDSLRRFEAQVVGTGWDGNARTFAKWLYYVGGSGTVAAN